jgi:ACS family sodium-dependent inorganic phosphate cotransporter
MSNSLDERQPFWQKRYTVLALTFIAFVICYLDRVNISLAAISMQQEFGWSNVTKGYVFSAFFWGYLLMQIGGGYLANRFGAKLVLGCAVVFWSLFTILTPWAALISLPALLAVRFLMGLGEAGLAPSSLAVVSRWFPRTEHSRAMGFLSSGAIFGTILALLTGGWIIQSYGWASIFYLYGVLGIIWAVFWYFLFKNSPRQDSSISSTELATIEDGGGITEKAPSIPWKKLWSTPQVWALCLTGFAASWVLYIFLSWLPSYFADVHEMDITGAGLYALFPWITMFIMLNVGGWISDRMIKSGMSITHTRKIIAGIGLFGSAVMMMFLRDAGGPEMATFLMCCALGISAFAFAALVPNCLDIAPRYAEIVYGTVNTFGTLAGAIGAFVAGYIVQTTESYDNVFLLTAIILVSAGIVFSLFGSGEQVID